jgi:hypothetical protein
MQMPLGKPHRALAAAAALATTAALAPAASATITPTLTLTPGSTNAGAKTTLGMDFNFAPSAGDSVNNLTVTLPAGLLADASINGGACLAATTPNAACQVASGTVYTTALPAGAPVTLDLAKAPNAADLAGLGLDVNGAPAFAGTGDVTVRPASDPAGVGLNFTFSNLGALGVTRLNASFNVHMPDSCPTPPASVAATAANFLPTVMTSPFSQTLTVQNCAQEPFAPKLFATAVKDASDSGVKVTTAVTQAANESPSKTVVLSIPAAVLSPNLLGVAGVINKNVVVGTATAVSPLIPVPLQGKVYVVSTPTLGISVQFPAPFGLTLFGALSAGTTASSVTFSNDPDVPLTALSVTLNGGANAAFETTCNPSSGTLTGMFSGHNGGTVTTTAPVTITGCSSRGGGGGGGTTAGKPTIGGGSASGLASGKPKLSFKLTAGQRAPKLASFTVKLPGGLSFVSKKLSKGVSLTGAKIKSLKLKGGKLVVTLKSAAASFTVKLSTPALSESKSLAKRVRKHKVKSLSLLVTATDASGKTSSLPLKLTKLH